MKRILSLSALLIALLTSLWAGIGSALRPAHAGIDSSSRVQSPTTPTSNGRVATLKRDFQKGLPFPVGEKLEYEVRFSRFPIYATVGTVTLEHLGSIEPSNGGTTPATPHIDGLNATFTPDPGESLIRLRGTAVSRGVLLAILGIDVLDRFENIVTSGDFSTRVAFMELKEGKKHRIQSAIFDTSGKQINYLTNDLANPATPPKVKSLPREDGMLSLLSAIYFIRLQKLKEGETLFFPVSYDNENFRFEVLVGKTEKLETECGKIKTTRLEPKLFGPGKFFSRKGEMTMWMSRDKLQLPLRLVAKTGGNTITARLLNFRKNCQLVDPDAEK